MTDARRSGGGSFDFSSYEIDAASLPDPLVTLHEQEHSGFVRGTVFGFAQHVAEFLHRATARPELAQLKWTLWRASMRTHERGATFCSVKALPSAGERELVDSLPPAYARFYAELASVVDAVFASSHLQYLFGKAITNAVLDPPLHRRLAAAERLSDLSAFALAAPDAPDERWNALVGGLRATGLASVAAEARMLVSQEGRALPGPIDDEETWSRLALQDASALEESLYGLLDRLLRDVCAGVEIVARDELDGAQEELAQTLGHLTGTRLTVEAGSESATFLGDLAAGIRNPRAIDRRQLRRLDSGELGRLAGAGLLPRYAVTTVDADGISKADWTLVFEHAGELQVARCAHADVAGLLRSRLRLALLGSPLPELQTVVRVRDSGRFAETYDALVPLYVAALRDGFLDLSARSLYWYMSGDLGAWWSSLRDHGPLRVLPIMPEDDWRLLGVESRPLDEVAARLARLEMDALGSLQEQPALRDGRVLLLWISERLAGSFVRVIPGRAAATFYRLVEGELREIDVEKRAALGGDLGWFFGITEQLFETY
jgi:hypothetical protein